MGRDVETTRKTKIGIFIFSRQMARLNAPLGPVRSHRHRKLSHQINKTKSEDDQDKPQLSGRTRGMWTLSFFPHPFISQFSHSPTFLSAIRARRKSANDGHFFVELRGFS